MNVTSLMCMTASEAHKSCNILLLTPLEKVAQEDSAFSREKSRADLDHCQFRLRMNVKLHGSGEDWRSHYERISSTAWDQGGMQDLESAKLIC